MTSPLTIELTQIHAKLIISNTSTACQVSSKSTFGDIRQKVQNQMKTSF